MKKTKCNSQGRSVKITAKDRGPDAARLRAAMTKRWPSLTPVHASVAAEVNNITGASSRVYCDDIGAILCGKRSLAGAKGGAILKWVESQEASA